MLKILWKRGDIAPEEQFLLLSTIFSYLMLDFYVKTRIRFSLRDKLFFEVTEVEITRVDCIFTYRHSCLKYGLLLENKMLKFQTYGTQKHFHFLGAFALQNLLTFF